MGLLYIYDNVWMKRTLGLVLLFVFLWSVLTEAGLVGRRARPSQVAITRGSEDAMTGSRSPAALVHEPVTEVSASTEPAQEMQSRRSDRGQTVLDPPRFATFDSPSRVVAVS